MVTLCRKDNLSLSVVTSAITFSKHLFSFNLFSVNTAEKVRCRVPVFSIILARIIVVSTVETTFELFFYSVTDFLIDKEQVLHSLLE